MVRPTIYVDVDETLVYTRVLYFELDVFCGGLETKMSWLGYNARDLKSPSHLHVYEKGKQSCGPAWDALLERHFLQCVLWLGKADADPLTGLLPLVEKKLSAQMSC